MVKQKQSLKVEAKERRRAKQAQIKKQLEEKGIFTGKGGGNKRMKKEDWLEENAAICFVCGNPGLCSTNRKTYPASKCSDEIICHINCAFPSERFMNSLISLTWWSETYYISNKQSAFNFEKVDSYTSSDGIRRRTLRFKEQNVERRGGLIL